MLTRLRSWLAERLPKGNGKATKEIVAVDASGFAIDAHIHDDGGFPELDWSAANRWLESIPDSEALRKAWTGCVHGWLLRLRSTLGPSFHVRERADALLLSDLDAAAADATLEFMSRTRRRIAHVLEGIAPAQDAWPKILIAFADQDTYYRYVARTYEGPGEFATSGGMHLSGECPHFVMVRGNLEEMERTIAHEMTHASVDHLPLPLWLNEGLAVNTEERLCPSLRRFSTPRERNTPAEMHEKHRGYWTASSIQAFWSGESFHRTDGGQALSYDLARIMVEQLCTDWDAFRDFVLAANAADAGAAAATQHLNLDLGRVAAALLERRYDVQWSPYPAAWPARS